METWSAQDHEEMAQTQSKKNCTQCSSLMGNYVLLIKKKLKENDSLTSTSASPEPSATFKGTSSESREEIEEELAKGKRVRVRLLKETTPPRSRSEAEDAKATHTNQKKAAEEAKQNNLLTLLKERKIRRKQSPLCPTPSKIMRAHTLSDSLSEEDDDDDDDGGGVVPEKLFEEAKKKQQLYIKKINNMSLQLQETKNKLEEQEKLRTEIEAENKELRSLNMQLQQQLLKALKSSSTAKCSDPGAPSPKETLQKSGCLNEVEPSVSSEGDEIHLGGDVRVRREAWSRIQNSTRDSLFVKELAVAIWGTKTLAERSLTGKECPTTKTSRQPLTPQKLQTLKVCFKEWLDKKNVEETESQARWIKAGRFITEKIMDINRLKKKL
ncbi:BEN domain-containing protein 5-like isoform X1 [Xyrauchen texanus]|uniref:BEN domain-containing protein 5-like isoform X1 n=1 Tax=Xyrauchen texanus TaxID=154827 RepID=UPI0022422589|nr:BEN domain-containing protein 5-like isoform X1 [Xyrauchen texanus]